MKGLLKSHIFQLVRNKLLYISFVVAIVFNFINFTSEYFNREDGYTAGHMIADSGFNLQCMAIMFAIICVGLVVCSDFTDKTANYELMSGHTRAESYFSKAILGIVTGTIGYVIVLAAPVALASIVGGFGYEIPFTEILYRGFVSLFPAIRIMCEFVFISFLVRNPYIILGCGFSLYFIGPAITAFLNDKTSFFLGLTCMNRLGQFQSWVTYTLDDVVNLIYVYGDKIKSYELIGIIGSSVIVAALALYLGYKFIEKDDLR